MAYIYSITNLVNQKQYIGLTRDDNPYNRWKRHIKDSKHNPKYPIHKAINKYGLDNFKFRILEECNDSIVEEREVHYISKYNSFYEGYNATLGGNIRYDTNAKAITSYNKKGEKIKDYPSLKDAVDDINGDQGAISKCANGERFSAYGYRWGWKDQGLSMLKIPYFTSYYGYNKIGEYKEWISGAEVSKELNCGRRTVYQSAKSPKENKVQCKGWYIFVNDGDIIDVEDITFAKRYKPSKEKAREMSKIGLSKRWGKIQ